MRWPPRMIQPQAIDLRI